MTSITGGGSGIRKVDPNEGFGTITPDDGGRDIYFEVSVVEGGTVPRVGQRVDLQAEMRGTAGTATRVAIVSQR